MNHRYIPNKYKVPSKIGKLYKITSTTFFTGMIILTVTDWLWAYYSIPLFIALSRYLRAFLLAVFIAFIFQTGIDFSIGGMRHGRVLQLMAAIMLIYAAFDPEIGEGMYQYFRTLYWITGSVVAYRLTALGLMDLKKLVRFIKIVCWIALGFTYFYIQTELFVYDYNASAYLLLYCIPILLIDTSRFSFFTICLSVLGILVTVKRGAILGLVLSLLGYLIVFILLKPTIKRLIYAGAIIGFFSIVGVVGVYMQWERMQERMQVEQFTDPEKGGSGRMGMWSILIADWMEGNPFEKFFGKGNRGVVLSWSFAEHARYAHSDIIAFLYNFGIVGLMMLLGLHTAIINKIVSLFRRGHKLTPSIVMSYITLFCVNVYSEAFVGPQVLFLFLSISFISASSRNPEFLPHNRRLNPVSINRLTPQAKPLLPGVSS